MEVLFFIYVILGYWATGKTLFYNKIVCRAPGVLFGERLGLGILLGWILIPVALLMKLFHIR